VAGFVEAIVWEIGVEEASRAVGRGFAGCVAQDEEELFVSWLFDDWFELDRFFRRA
jgi:hypothetical protein